MPGEAGLRYHGGVPSWARRRWSSRCLLRGVPLLRAQFLLGYEDLKTGKHEREETKQTTEIITQHYLKRL